MNSLALWSIFCCPVNFKTAEKYPPKPFRIGLRAFFFKKQAPRKSNNDGRIRRPGGGQEANGVAQSALSKEGACSFSCGRKTGLCSSFFPCKPQSVPIPRGVSQSCQCLPIGRDSVFGGYFDRVGISQSRDVSVSQRAFAPGGREKFLDFALYRRRSAAG